MKNKKSKSYRSRMLLLIIIITILPAVLMIGSMVYLTRASLETEIFAVLTEKSQSDASALTKILDAKLSLLEHTASAPSIQALAAGKTTTLAEEYTDTLAFFKRLVNESSFVYMLLSDQNGQLIVDYGNSAFLTENTDLVTEIKSDLSRFGQTVIIESLPNNAGILISLPIDGAVLTAIVPIYDFYNVITDLFIVDDNTELYIIENGQLVFTERENSRTQFNGLFEQSTLEQSHTGTWVSGSNEAFLYSIGSTNFKDANFQWQVYHIESAQHSFQPLRNLVTIELGIAGIFFLLVFVLSWFTSGSLSSPIRKLAEVTERMAQGTLKVYIPEQSGINEVNLLAQSIKKLQTSLLFQITSINEISSQIGASISQISAAIMELAANATETTSSITEISATVEETRETSAIATSKSQSVAINSESTLDMADEGQIATRNAVEGMETIRDEMNSMATRINQLSEQTQSIGSIINTVEDIAEQSNLLAVNAAIEAAKAGEAGAGFAVVAQEVKNMAEQSKEATIRIRTILEEIRKATSATVLAAERSGKAVESGAVRTAQVGDTITHLAQAISESADTATQISISSQEQLTGMNQLVLAIEAIQNASSQNADSTQQIEASIQLLSQLGQNLEELVSGFEL